MSIATVDRIRQNHALEHAAVAVLLERAVRPPLGGYSLPAGFFIWATATPDEIADAAGEAIRLLNMGHAEMAISPYCGTNMVVSAVLGGLAALAAGQGHGLWPKIRGAATGIVVAGVLSQPVGKFIQRNFTTQSDVSGIEIRSIRTLKRSPLTIVWVSTGQLKRPLPNARDIQSNK